jgi:hypothetical protein
MWPRMLPHTLSRARSSARHVACHACTSTYYYTPRAHMCAAAPAVHARHSRTTRGMRHKTWAGHAACTEKTPHRSMRTRTRHAIETLATACATPRAHDCTHVEWYAARARHAASNAHTMHRASRARNEVRTARQITRARNAHAMSVFRSARSRHANKVRALRYALSQNTHATWPGDLNRVRDGMRSKNELAKFESTCARHVGRYVCVTRRAPQREPRPDVLRERSNCRQRQQSACHSQACWVECGLRVVDTYI